jgi:hypothetical protein
MLRLQPFRILPFLLLFAGAQLAHAGIVEVTARGTIGTPFFPFAMPSGINPGDSFELTFRFDDDPAQASVPLLVGETDETGFEFSGPAYGVSGMIGSLSIAFDRTVAGLADDENLTLSESYGLVPPGIYDGFLLAGQSADGDFDLSGPPSIGTHVGVGIYSTLLSTYPDASWYQAPPALGDGVDTLMSFGVFSGDVFAGVPVPSVLALGKVTSLDVTAVPLPAAGWLFAAAIGVLAGVRRRLA